MLSTLAVNKQLYEAGVLYQSDLYRGQIRCLASDMAGNAFNILWQVFVVVLS
jgi:hypothetical protein